ncbi:MAG: hypothetical protein R2806_00250 [Saprospiraceae bacterium]
MKRKGFSVEQVLAVSKHVEHGTPVCKKMFTYEPTTAPRHSALGSRTIFSFIILKARTSR